MHNLTEIEPRGILQTQIEHHVCCELLLKMGIPQLFQALSTVLTILTPLGTDAVEEAEVVDLAVAVLYVQLSKTKVDLAALWHADLPLAHCVVGVRVWVAQRGQGATDGAEHTGATAIT